MRVSDHAVFRYLERVDPTEPHPRTAVRAALERAEPADDRALELHVDDETGAVLVVRSDRSETVVTILPFSGGADK